jgi:hypothetical protein
MHTDVVIVATASVVVALPVVGVVGCLAIESSLSVDEELQHHH